MTKTSQAMLKAINKYNKEKCDEFKIRLPKGNKEILKTYCKDKNKSVNSLIAELLQERLTKDGYDFITREAPDRVQYARPCIEESNYHNTLPQSMPFIMDDKFFNWIDALYRQAIADKNEVVLKAVTDRADDGTVNCKDKSGLWSSRVSVLKDAGIIEGDPGEYRIL